MSTENPDTTTELSDFDKKKQQYFIRLAASVREMLKLHIEHGLLISKNKINQGEENFKNVSEHCLVEAARVRTLARLIQLSPETIRELELAATVHDFFKRKEVEITKEQGGGWESFLESGRQSDHILQENDMSPEFIHLASAMEPVYTPYIDELLAKEQLTDAEIAWLIMHYVDNYTINAQWANEATQENEMWINDTDRRTRKNANNPSYKKLDEESRAHLGGESLWECRARQLPLIEQKLANLIKDEKFKDLNPKQLPEVVDQLIREEIEQPD